VIIAFTAVVVIMADLSGFAADRGGIRSPNPPATSSSLTLQMKSILILKTGSAPEIIRRQHGDFEDWFRALLQVEALPVSCIDVTAASLPDPTAWAGVLITGSSAMVTDHLPWSEACAAWLGLARQADVPLLGVCYGHQLLASALGGAVADNPGGRIIGGYRFQSQVAAVSDPLLGALPDRFRVQKTHCQCVVALPPGATSLGHTPGDPHTAFRVGEHAWGVQFHPEFSARVTREYILARQAHLQTEGLDVAATLDSVTETAASTAVVERFAGYCAARLTNAPDSLQGSPGS